MRPGRTIVLMLMTGLLIGAGSVPKVGVPALGDNARSVGRFLTPWREVGPLAFAPDGSSVTVIAGRDHQASLPYAFIYRMDGQQATKVDDVKLFTLSPGAGQLLAYARDASKVVVVATAPSLRAHRGTRCRPSTSSPAAGSERVPSAMRPTIPPSPST